MRTFYQQALTALVCGFTLAAMVWSCLDMPVLQVSYSTKQPVACASKETNWKTRPADDPVCVEVAKGRADVEWVP